MRRRKFISLLGGPLATWPLAAGGQQSNQMRRVGILLPASKGESEEQRRLTAFVTGLQELGWTEGGNVQIDVRWCGSDIERIRSAAQELVDLKPDAVVADSALTMGPLQQLTRTIAIVFLQITDPVESSFVSNVARPGRNVTGFTPGEFSIRAKMLEVLKQIAPQVRHVQVIYNAVQAPQLGMVRAIETIAPSLGVQVVAANASNADEITHATEGTASKPDSGMIVLPNPVTTDNRGLVIALMARYRLPAAYAFSFFVRDGGLVSYGTDNAVQFRQAASYVDRILKGANPGDLPVQGPTKFELAINLKTAKALGLTISRDFLLVADEVIE
jgi:putative ABC transport system substrate-binding protein